MRLVIQAADREGRQAALLAAYRLRSIDRINVASGQVRTQYVTNLPGQEMIYLRKEEEGRSYVLGIEPDIGLYPMIAAEIGITAPTAYEIAQIWINMSNLWVQVAAALETIRLGFIAQIQTAPSPNACDALLDEFREVMTVFTPA